MTPDEIEELERLRRKAIYEQRYSRVELIHMLAEAERERDELRQWQREAVGWLTIVLGENFCLTRYDTPDNNAEIEHLIAQAEREGGNDIDS